jgi:hypothetical protein
MYSDSVYDCPETSLIILEIMRAKSDCSASLQFDRRPMVLPYERERRLEANHIHFCGGSLQGQKPCSSCWRSCVPSLIPAHECTRIVCPWPCHIDKSVHSRLLFLQKACMGPYPMIFIYFNSFPGEGFVLFKDTVSFDHLEMVSDLAEEVARRNQTWHIGSDERRNFVQSCGGSLQRRA